MTYVQSGHGFLCANDVDAPRETERAVSNIPRIVVYRLLGINLHILLTCTTRVQSTDGLHNLFSFWLELDALLGMRFIVDTGGCVLAGIFFVSGQGLRIGSDFVRLRNGWVRHCCGIEDTSMVNKT